MVTKVSARDNNTVRLRAAAQYAESGDIRDVVNELWTNDTSNKQKLIDKVSAYSLVTQFHEHSLIFV